MRKLLVTIFVILLTSMSLYAFMPSNKGGDQELTKSLHKSGIKIIDIRTEPEWRQTGLVQGSYPITFFDEKGRYDVKAFLAQLNKVVTPAEPFALICRTGNRTGKITPLLKKLGYKNVIDLKGGVRQASRNGVPFQPYNK